MVGPTRWGDLEQRQRDALAYELATEVSSAHPLHGKALTVLARSEADDDILVALSPGGWAVVHLTWSRNMESPPWPSTTYYSTIEDLEHGLQERL